MPRPRRRTVTCTTVPACSTALGTSSDTARAASSDTLAAIPQVLAAASTKRRLATTLPSSAGSWASKLFTELEPATGVSLPVFHENCVHFCRLPPFRQSATLPAPTPTMSSRPPPRCSEYAHHARNGSATRDQGHLASHDPGMLARRVATY